jgi:hypothetical protein
MTHRKRTLRMADCIGVRIDEVTALVHCHRNLEMASKIVANRKLGVATMLA